MSTERTYVTKNLRDGEEVSLDGGRVRLTLIKRSGRLSRLRLDLAKDVLMDTPASSQEPDPREPPPFGGYLE